MKKMLLLLTGCFLVFSAAASMAQDAPPPAPPMPPQVPNQKLPDAIFPAPCLMSSLHIISQGGMFMLSNRLKLTDEQKPKVDDLMSKADTAIKAKIEYQKKAVETYTELLQKNDTTDTALLAAADEAMKAEAAIVVERLKTLQALRVLLDDQQKNELNTLLGRFANPKRTPSMIKN